MDSNKILGVKAVNELELFYLPTFLNKNIEHVIKIGEFSLADQINYCKQQGRHGTADSLIEQAQKKDKNFTYYVHWTKTKQSNIPFKQSRTREYFINVNLSVNSSNKDIIKAYFFALKLHDILDKKLDEKLHKDVRNSYTTLSDKDHKTRSQ